MTCSECTEPATRLVSDACAIGEAPVWRRVCIAHLPKNPSWRGTILTIDPSMIKIHPFTEHRNCNQHRFDHAVEEARDIARELPGATDIEVFYEPDKDFMHIEFHYEYPELGRVRYVIRIYKVRSLDVIHGGLTRNLWNCPYGISMLIDYIKSRRIVGVIQEVMSAT